MCMINGSWSFTAQFIECGWTWIDNLEIVTRNYIRRESAMHLKVEALKWVMESMIQHSTCQSFGTDQKDLIAMIKELQAWSRFSTELERIQAMQICFPNFKITHILRAQNQISDFLARTTRSFCRGLYFIGCYIPVLLSKLPEI